MNALFNKSGRPAGTRPLLARFAAVAAALALMVLSVPSSQEAYASDNTMDTPEYDVDIRVSENNSYNIDETLMVDFATPHHGIYRYIPINGSEITGISVPGYNYETYRENGNMVIKIGSGSYTLVGLNQYDISYKISMYEDENDEMDMLLLNVIPTGWETDIGRVNATITLPKEADLSKVEVYSGSYGTEGNEDNVAFETSADGRVITLTASDLPVYHGITVALPLPQGYWVGAKEFGVVTPWTWLLLLLGPVGAALMWWFFGRDERLVRTLEFYPPDDLTPGEVGYIVDGSADKRDLVSTIVYLADKGYIIIEQDDRKNFTFYAVQEPGLEVPQYVRTIYSGLFANGREKVSSRKLGTSFGRKYEKARTQLQNQFAGNKSLTTPESLVARGACAVAAIMPASAFCTWSSGYGHNMGMFEVLWAGAHILLTAGILCYVYDNIRSNSKVKTVLLTLLSIWLIAAGVGILPLMSEAVMNMSRPRAYAITAALYIGTLICLFFAVISIARRREYTRLLGRILGFKDFIRTAELDKLKALVEEDPEYFYHITPYAYVFGLSDKWIKNFEDIPLFKPQWYHSEFDRFDRFDAYMMGRMMSDCSSSVSSHIVIPAAPSHSGGSSGGGWSGGGSSWSGGGGFSGGGFSGGGSGGGGGGGW